MLRIVQTCAIVLTVLLTPVASLAQSLTRPGPNAATYHEELQIGPVSGWTTVWHSAPTQTAVPLGVTLQLKARTRAGVVEWTGAREVAGSQGVSTAEVKLLTPGPRVVAAKYTDRDGERREERILLNVLDTRALPVSISTPRLWADPVVVDETSPNQSSMDYFFGGSIAAVRQIDDARYRTSVNRWFHAAVDVEPAAFAPLVEWRINGKAQRHLGTAIDMQVFAARSNAIEVGSDRNPTTVELETYRVKITSHKTNTDKISQATPIRFTAVTEPPGYEDEITWLASTKYGSCEPASGQGPEFEVAFYDTFGPDQQWLGVKADNGTFGQDQKGNDGNALSLVAELRPSVSKVMEDAAASRSLSIDSNGTVFTSRDDFVGAGSLLTEVEDLTEEDFEDGAEVMFTHLSGDLPKELAIEPGFYTVRITGSDLNSVGTLVAKDGTETGPFDATLEFRDANEIGNERNTLGVAAVDAGIALRFHFRTLGLFSPRRWIWGELRLTLRLGF